MNSIYLSKHCTLKSYSAKSSGKKALVEVKIEVSDHLDLGYLLRELEETIAGQRQAKATAAPKPERAPKRLPAPLLQLTHLRGDDE